jgi:ppGpp synthetase/RelA/SpoT-type nucleotidyltranferase
LQQEKSALVDLEERAKEDASLLCKIIKKKIEISLLQNSENKASLININIAFKLANGFSEQY